MVAGAGYFSVIQGSERVEDIFEYNNCDALTDQ